MATMRAKQIGNGEADEHQEYGAYLNAKMTSAVNESLFSARQKIAADRMKLAMQMCYRAKDVYVTYRKTGIAVKVDQIITIAARKQLRLLEADYVAAGYIKKHSKQGITYWIPLK